MTALRAIAVEPVGRKTIAALACLAAAILLAASLAIEGGLVWLALLAAVVLLVVVVRRPQAALVAFFFVFYLNLPGVASELHGVPEPAAGAVVLLLAVPIAAYVLLRRQPWVITPALPLILAYGAALFVAAAASSHPASSGRWAAGFLVEGLVLYFLVTNAIRSVDALEKVVWALLAAGSVMGVLSIYQELTHSYLSNLGGLAQVQFSGFKVGENIFGDVRRPRLAGSIGDPNRYAQVLLVLLPLALWRARVERSLVAKALAAGAGVLMVAGILLSFSRGAAAAFVGVLVLMFLLRDIRLRHVVAVVAAAAVTMAVVAPTYVIRLNSLQGVQGLLSGQIQETTPGADTAPDAAIVGRATENLAAWRTFLDHPIIGVGPGQFFRENSQQYANELNLRYLYDTRRAHDLYLEIAADVGLFGLAAFLGAVGVTVLHLLRVRRYWLSRRRERVALVNAVLGSLSAYLIAAIFLQLSYQRYFWSLLALANVTIWILTREAESEAVAEPREEAESGAQAGTRGPAPRRPAGRRTPGVGSPRSPATARSGQ